MKKNWNNALKKLKKQDPELFKRAASFLRKNLLLCAFPRENGSYGFIFSDDYDGKKTRSTASAFISLTGNGAVVSECLGRHGKRKINSLCIHTAAGLMHLAKFADREKTGLPRGKPGFRALHKENILRDSRKQQSERAELIVNAVKGLPHVPSKWEILTLLVRLKGSRREYSGNLANMRQLIFREHVGGGLKIDQFSLQEQQIIRFLALNSEGESGRLCLKSEAAAEFFHCLSGFPRFCCGNENLRVRSGISEPGVCVLETGAGYILQPSIIHQEKPIPLKNARIVLGKAGCWVGIAGEYFWVPGTVDIVWLRNFIRSAPETLLPEKAEKMISEFRAKDVKVLGWGPQKLALRSFTPHCVVEKMDESDLLELTLYFDYNGKLLLPGASRLESSGGDYWRRNTDGEKQAIRDLQCFGFRKKKGSRNVFSLQGIEAIGYFTDIFVPEWRSRGRKIYFGHGFANSVPDMALRFRLCREEKSHFEIACMVSAGLSPRWNDILKTAKNGRRYITAENGSLYRISPAMTEFVLKISSVMRPVQDSPESISLPRTALFYWMYAAKSFPPARIPRFREIEQIKDCRPEKIVRKLRSELEKNIKTQLRPYQLEGISWLACASELGFNPILADEMGLGKTVQALAFLVMRRLLHPEKPESPSLVLCPSSLVENWEMECKRFLPGFKTLAVTGSDRHAKWDRIHKSDLLVSSYALAKRDIKRYEGFLFDTLILDEAQHIKNPGTANARTCKSIGSSCRLVLTGTPLENNPTDLWSIFDFLNPHMLGSFRSFKSRYGSRDAKPEIQKELGARVSPFILRRKKNEVCEELPKKSTQLVYCDMKEAQQELYDRMLQAERGKMRKFLENSREVNRMNVLTGLLRLRQICCHPDILPEEINSEKTPSAKMDLFRELLLENIDSGHKLLVFSQFTSVLKIISSWLKKKNIDFEYLDGSTQNRMDRVLRFNSEEDLPVFLLSLKAGGTGLNLASADRVIIFDPWWNPAVENQAEDRTHRIGQKKPVSSMKLIVKNSIEEKIVELQQKKKSLFDNVVEQAEGNLPGLNAEEMEFLLS